MGVTREKVAAQLRRSVQGILDRGLHDPRVRGLVQVTRVELADDFGNATIHVSVLPPEHAELTMHGLRSAAKHMRSQVARRVDLRRTPMLHFKLDGSLRRAEGVMAAIAEAREADDKLRAARGGGDPISSPGDATADDAGDTGGDAGDGNAGERGGLAAETAGADDVRRDAPVDEHAMDAFDAFVADAEADATPPSATTPDRPRSGGDATT